MTWGDIVREFEAARGAEALLRVFVNTLLGLPFAPAAEKIDPTALMARAEPWGAPPVVPLEVGLLTAGVDVQADRLEYVVGGWCDREAQCVLEYGHRRGRPGQGGDVERADGGARGAARRAPYPRRLRGHGLSAGGGVEVGAVARAVQGLPDEGHGRARAAHHHGARRGHVQAAAAPVDRRDRHGQGQSRGAAPERGAGAAVGAVQRHAGAGVL
jgi:hypothetical protein